MQLSVWITARFSFERKGAGMKSKGLIGVTVKHKMFGYGVVESEYDNYIEVVFTQKSKRCKFSYPSCFQGFLELTTDEKKTDIEADLESWRIESGVEHKEALKEQYMKTQKAIMERRIAAEKRNSRLHKEQ